jgi:hypothetical protein
MHQNTVLTVSADKTAQPRRLLAVRPAKWGNSGGVESVIILKFRVAVRAVQVATRRTLAEALEDTLHS